MKITAIALAALLTMAISAPVCAETGAAGDLCNPKRIEECKAKIDSLLKSVDALRSKLLKSQMEINAGRKLTNEEADRMLKSLESVNQSLPATEGYMWDN